MILKFRESHISNLEKARKNGGPEDGSFVQDETNVCMCVRIPQPCLYMVMYRMAEECTCMYVCHMHANTSQV